MTKIFDNPNNLPGAVVQSRVRELDRNATAGVFDFNNVVEQPGVVFHYAVVDSDTLTEADINTVLSTPATDSEKNEYQNTLNTLQTIANLTTPTNAQIVQAINYLARTLRLVIKQFIRYY